MEFKRCESCTRAFTPEGTGRYSVMCRECVIDCDSACQRIRRFMRNNPSLSVEQHASQIAEGADTQALYVTMLYHECKLDVQPPQQEEKRTCKQCGATVYFKQATHCMKCESELITKIEEVIQNTPEEPQLKSPPSPGKPQPQEIKLKQPERPSRDTRYGLKRNF